jgi:hypothetical protein
MSAREWIECVSPRKPAQIILKIDFCSQCKMIKLVRILFARNYVNSKSGKHDAGVRQRFKEEMRAYVIISFYLWICFSALLLYENSILRTNDLELLPLSGAAIKALILGKFILIGRVFKVGEWFRHEVVLYQILWKSLATMLLLLIFASVEDLLVGLVHGHAIADIMVEMMARSWVQWVAPSLIMLLVLIPFIAFEKVDASIGKGSLSRILLGRSQS